MTRLIRIESCDQCPHSRAFPGEFPRCVAATEDYHGATVSRRFRPADNYPEIPHWCPLEESL